MVCTFEPINDVPQINVFVRITSRNSSLVSQSILAGERLTLCARSMDVLPIQREMFAYRFLFYIFVREIDKTREAIVGYYHDKHCGSPFSAGEVHRLVF